MESQAKVLSTIQRHLSTWKPLGRIFSQSMTVSFGAQTPRWPLQGCSTTSTSQPNVSLLPLDEVAFLVRAVDPDQLEPRKTAAQWLQEVFAALVIQETGLMHQHMEDQTQGVDEHVPFTPFHFLATVIPASPPF